jgi:hypothetical protein
MLAGSLVDSHDAPAGCATGDRRRPLPEGRKVLVGDELVAGAGGERAVSNAHFFAGTDYPFATLHTWGWITIIVGAIQLSGGVSLIGGGAYGRVIGIVAATLGAIESLLSIGGRDPWWALGIFVGSNGFRFTARRT